jgi:hypothetical protein
LFLVNYHDGESVTEIGAASTLGWGKVLAGSHHLDVLAARSKRPVQRSEEFAAELAAGRALLSRTQKPPCEQCLRATPCRERCLRSMLDHPPRELE